MLIRRTLHALLLFVILGAHVTTVSAQTVDDALRADIEALLDASGAANVGQQLATIISGQILDGLKQSNPNIPDRAIAVAKEVLASEFGDAFGGQGSLKARIVAIYANHFTREDIRGLLAFYQSDVGKKLVGLQPVLVQESAQAGRAWAEQRIPQITDKLKSRLRAEGFIK